MKQEELVNEIKGIPGFKGLYHRAEDFRDKDVKGLPIPNTGKQQIYTVWQKANGVLKSHRIDMLVLGKGTPEEVAETFIPLALFDIVATPFLDELTSKIPQYKAAHPEVEKVVIDSCNEAARMARVTTYEYDSVADVTNECRMIVYEVSGRLTIRKFNAITGV